MLTLAPLQEWIAQHKDKKLAQDAEVKRKEDVRAAVDPAVAAYDEAKKALKKATTDRRAAVKAANDPPAAVRHTLCPTHCAMHCSQLQR